MNILSRSTVGATVVAGCLVAASMVPASAKPSDIDYGVLHDHALGYSAYAEFFTGTGHIRAVLGCDSGDEHYTVYGKWVAKGGQSSTPYCASSSSTSGDYETKNT